MCLSEHENFAKIKEFIDEHPEIGYIAGDGVRVIKPDKKKWKSKQRFDRSWVKFKRRKYAEAV